VSLSKDEVAALIARDIPHGSYVNVGIGQPNLVADHLPEGSGVVLYTENGLLNKGPAAKNDEIDPDLANAGKILITELPGASYFHNADSFAMMRGGHLDVCVLGAFPDLRKRRLGQMAHRRPRRDTRRRWRDGPRHGREERIRDDDALREGRHAQAGARLHVPLTGVGCENRVYTDVATFQVGPGHQGGALVLDTFGITYDQLTDRLHVPLTRHATRRNNAGS
jgi:3-oxoadipate CoA-transferase beta subunit